MKKLYIIRGLPGSGKTTLAYELGAVVCEADQFFVDSNGDYKFDKNLISVAHKWCREKVINAMLDGYNCIAVSNTFSRRWEFADYIAYAQKYDYQIVEITLTGDTYANTHNVPEETIQAMKDRWEN